MHQNTKDGVLNAEEMEYLSALLTEQAGKPAQGGLKFEVSTDNHGFLQQLGLSDTLKVVARYGHHRFVFPLSIEVNDLGMPHLYFNTPDIYEDGEQSRFWRAEDEQLTLLTADGEPLAYCIQDISVSGLCIELKDPTQSVPDNLSELYLRLPNGQTLALSGNISRYIEPNLVAYELELSSLDSSELKDYLFQLHRSLHPHLMK